MNFVKIKQIDVSRQKKLFALQLYHKSDFFLLPNARHLITQNTIFIDKREASNLQFVAQTRTLKIAFINYLYQKFIPSLFGC